MRVSLNTVKQFTDIDMPVDELVASINSQLGGTEGVINLADKYKDAVIVKVEQCEKHPDADRLNVTKINDNGVVENVERDENGLVQVVCGAPNVRAGLFAVWLPPRSIVPATYSDDEPFVLGARELRGVMSQGMLAAADELGIGSNHEGILEINPEEWKPGDVEIAPGVSFALAYGLDDTIIEIENKMFTHRPDLFGQLGVAREIAGIQHKRFVSPVWYTKTPEFKQSNSLELEVFNNAGDMVPRFMAVAIKDIEVKPSPLWLQCALVSMGGKPINNIVDVTNYIMLLTAQPTHAYDYDKLRGHKLGARMAKKGERAELLNGKTYQLDDNDTVIVDGEGIVGLGGIMGGGNSEVSADTKNIVLEVANFDMYTVRKSSMRHGIFTDALTRFNKGQSPLQNNHIMSLLIQSVFDVSGGEQASDVYDSGIEHVGEAVHITSAFINERLGSELDDNQIATLLQNVEIEVSTASEGMLEVAAPFWRTDIEIAEDVVEEVGRLYGFDRLPRILPLRTTKPTAKNPIRELKRHIRETLSRAGANEVLTYSFVHEKVMQKAEQDSKHAYKISNALSPDLQYYRLSLIPSLLDKIHMNYKAGHGQFALFELGKTHYKGEMDVNETTVPNENNHVAFVYASKQNHTGAAYYTALRYLKEVVDISEYDLIPLAKCNLNADERSKQLVSAYEPTRSAVIVKEQEIQGIVGEFKASVRKAFKLPNTTAGFEIHLNIASMNKHTYRSLSKFPSITQDISLKVAYNLELKDLIHVVESITKEQKGLTIDMNLVTIYQANDDKEFKTVTLRFKVTSYEQTLKDSDVTKILDDIATAAAASVNAERI